MKRIRGVTRKSWFLMAAALLALAGVMAGEGPALSEPFPGAPTGYLIVPDHHPGNLGDNSIPVTATGLQAGVWYQIKMDVSYHENPRTPPDPSELPPPSFSVLSDPWLSDGSDFNLTFIVPLPDCNWQITVGFTLLYSPSGDPSAGDWTWNGDERATEGVNIWSDCPPTPTPTPLVRQGCTPGFWKNHLSAWGPTGFSPSDDFDTTFGVDLFDPDITLEQALNLGGGGVGKLARHGTAALLSALHPDVAYPLTVAQVIAAVQAGDVDLLVAFNELGCPIN